MYGTSLPAVLSESFSRSYNRDRHEKQSCLLVTLLEGSGNISGLKINEKKKKEVFWLGSLRAAPEDIGISTVNKPMKILGICFTYDRQKFQELNVENIIKSIKRSINP